MQDKAIYDGNIRISTFQELDIWFKGCLRRLRQLDPELQTAIYPVLVKRMQEYHTTLMVIRNGYDGQAEPTKKGVQSGHCVLHYSNISTVLHSN